MGVYKEQQSIGANKAIVTWLWTGVVMIFLMVAIGGITRLTESGLSIVDWKPLMGTLPPLSEADWQETFNLYKQSPQFKEQNSHFALGDFKRIFWWEYIHRVFGRLIGLVFFIPFIYFLIKKQLSRALVKRLLIVMLLGAMQALLGWYMVKSGLIDVPRVSHFRLAAHLITAFATISYLYWVILELQYEKKSVLPDYRRFSGWAISLLIMLVIQIVYGAFVAGKDAGLIHNTWPYMDGYFIHPAATAMDSFWESMSYSSSMIQYIHRTLAILVFTFVLSLKWEAVKRKAHSLLNKTYTFMAIVVVLQFVLGVLTLLMKVPITLAVLHQAGALVLLLLVIRANYLNRVEAVS